MKSANLTPNQIQELSRLISHKDSTSKEIKRSQAILMVDQRPEDIAAITRITGYGRSRIFGLRHKYLRQGIVSLEDPARRNPKELLSKKQRDKIVATVKNKQPDDVGLHGSYWTIHLLGEHIKRSYKVAYKSKTSLYLVFKKASFSYHKPGRKYHLSDEREVACFRKKTAKILGKYWSDSNTVILCGDEMVLSTQTTFQKIWLPQGEYPKIEISNKKENRSVYGFLNVKTGTEYAYKTDWQNMFITVDILKQLREIYPTQNLLIFWDGAGWHRGSKVQEFIKADGKIETIYFPRYSPEENPQEHVWKNGRKQVTHNRFIEDIDAAADEFVAYLNNHKCNYSLLGFESVLGM